MLMQSTRSCTLAGWKVCIGEKLEARDATLARLLADGPPGAAKQAMLHCSKGVTAHPPFSSPRRPSFLSEALDVMSGRGCWPLRDEGCSAIRVELPPSLVALAYQVIA
jgi:hypothetical protein